MRCGPPETCRQGTTDVTAPTEGATCRHDSRPGQWVRLDEQSANPLYGCVPYYPATAAGPEVPDLAGARLDRAEDLLAADGIRSDTEGDTGILGVIDPSNWTVCEVRPPAGTSLQPGEDVLLMVAHDCS